MSGVFVEHPLRRQWTTMYRLNQVVRVDNVAAVHNGAEAIRTSSRIAPFTAYAISNTMIQPHPPPVIQRFHRPSFVVEATDQPRAENAIGTLVDLAEYNAKHNAEHVFCIQYYHNLDTAPFEVTYGALYDAVLRCCDYLVNQAAVQLSIHGGGATGPAAILMSSDVSWFITFLSLLKLGVPVSPPSIALDPH